MREQYPLEVLFKCLAVLCRTIFLAWFFYRSLWAVLILLPVSLCFFIMEMEDLKRKKKLQTELIFQEFMVSLSAGLRAGYSLSNGFEEAYRELRNLYGDKRLFINELRRIGRGIRDGKRTEEMLEDVGNDLRCDSMENLGRTLKVATFVGGNMNKTLGRAEKVLKNKISLLQDIEDGMAGRRYEAKIMEIMPFALVLYVEWGTPGYTQILFQDMYGRGIMTLCLFMYLLAKVWMFFIVKESMEV